MRKRFFTEKRIEILLRFWAAGAVYYFIGWGTGLGTGSVKDFILMLGLVMAILEILIVNPIIRNMLNLESVTEYHGTTLWSKVLYNLLYILKAIAIMAVVAAVYSVINKSAILLFSLPEDAVFLPGEPILFGIFYLAVFKLSDGLIKNIIQKARDVKR